jgi:hypothetical protein
MNDSFRVYIIKTSKDIGSKRLKLPLVHYRCQPLYECETRVFKSYIFYFILKIIGIVAIFHQKHEFLFTFRVVIELDYIFMIELGMNGALVTRILMLCLTNEFIFLYCFSYYSL